MTNISVLFNTADQFYSKHCASIYSTPFSSSGGKWTTAVYSVENGFLVGSSPKKQITIPWMQVSRFIQRKQVQSKQRSQSWSHWRKRHRSHFHFFPPLLFSPSSTSSSLAFEISFLSNTNFKRRLSSSGSQISFTPHCNMKTNANTYTPTHECPHAQTSTHISYQREDMALQPLNQTHTRSN